MCDGSPRLAARPAPPISPGLEAAGRGAPGHLGTGRRCPACSLSPCGVRVCLAPCLYPGSISGAWGGRGPVGRRAAGLLRRVYFCLRAKVGGWMFLSISRY